MLANYPKAVIQQAFWRHFPLFPLLFFWRAGDLLHLLSFHNCIPDSLCVDGQSMKYLSEKMCYMAHMYVCTHPKILPGLVFPSFFQKLLIWKHCLKISFSTTHAYDYLPFLILNEKDALGPVPLGGANSYQNFGVKCSDLHHNQLPLCTLCDHKCSFLWFNKYSEAVQCGAYKYGLRFRVLGLNSGCAICCLCDLNKLLTCFKPQHLKMKIKIVLLHEIVTVDSK